MPRIKEEKIMSKQFPEITLSDHAEAWWREKGNIVPEKNTQEWEKMYALWVEYAFKTI